MRPTKLIAASRARQPRIDRQKDRGAAMVNHAMEQIVLKVLAKKADWRYQTAGELGRIFPTISMESRPPSRPHRSDRQPDPWKTVARSAGAVGQGHAVMLALRPHGESPSVPIAVSTQPTTVARGSAAGRCSCGGDSGCQAGHASVISSAIRPTICRD